MDTPSAVCIVILFILVWLNFVLIGSQAKINELVFIRLNQQQDLIVKFLEAIEKAKKEAAACENQKSSTPQPTSSNGIVPPNSTSAP